MNNCLIIANVDPTSMQILNNLEDIKNILNSQPKHKFFNIHPEFYKTKAS